MKPPPFEYHAPASLDEACSLLATHDGAKVLAGGQSLVPMLNLRLLYPDHVIDINGIPKLSEIVVHPDRVAIGAMVRQRRLETDPEIALAAPIFTEALPLIGHRQTRNRGTIGGSLCHLDPAAELPLVALVHEATIHTVSSGGRERTIPIAHFIGGFMSPTIEPDELVVSIDVPRWPAGHGYAFIEHARRHGDFALAAVACLIALDGNGRIARVALGVGGIGPVAVRLAAAETLLSGSAADPAIVERAARCCDELDALTDVHGHAAYRRSLAAALVHRAIASAYARAARKAA